MSQKLKPCPFCGSEDIDRHGWYDGQGQQGPECMGCGATACDADAWSRRTPPEGMALVPREITAETGHKAALMGEFHEHIGMQCPECEGSEDGCDICGGSGEYALKVPASWASIKAIHRRIVEISRERDK